MTPIAVVVVNWNTCQLLRTCLQSVLAQRPAEIVAVDNGSTDGSVEMMRQEFPSVAVLVNPDNPGYGAAANRAIAACQGEYILLLNSDTELRAGALTALAACFDGHPRAGLVGPRLLNPDGTVQESCFPFPRPLRPLTKWALRSYTHDRPQVVPWVVGAALGLRRAAFEAVGGFDESYRMYFEEVDLAFRLNQSGWETRFTPSAEVVHIVAASTSQRRAEMALRTRLSAREFFRRHHSGLALTVALAMEYALTAGRLVRDVARYGVARSTPHKQRLKEDLAVWWELLRHPRPTTRS